MVNEAFAYYLLRSAQRFVLFFLGLLTFAYWTFLITVSYITTVEFSERQRANSESLNNLTNQTLSGISRAVTIWAVAAICITVVLFMIPRVKKYEKRLITDSIVFVVFCLVAVAAAQTLIANFLSKLAV